MIAQLNGIRRSNNIQIATYLWSNFLPDFCESACGINILLVHHLGYIQKNQRLSVDEAIEDVLLQSLMVIFDILSLSDLERVVAVREDDRGQLVLVVQEVAAMKVGDGNVVLTPEGMNATIIPIKTMS